MIKLDENKLRQLPTANKMLDQKYGTQGTIGREAFDAESRTWYYTKVLKNARRQASADNVPPGWVDYEDGVYYYPTEETVAALEENRRGRATAPKFNDVDELLAYLHS